MIVQNIVLIAAIAVPVVLLVLLRTNAAIVFFTLCAGSLLVKFIGDDANLVGAAASNNSQVVSQYAELVLLLLPAVIVALVLRKTVSQTKLLFNVLAAVAVGFVAVILAVPLLPGAVQTTITKTQGWELLQHNQEVVIAAAVLVSVITLLIMQPRHSGKKKH